MAGGDDVVYPGSSCWYHARLRHRCYGHRFHGAGLCGRRRSRLLELMEARCANAGPLLSSLDLSRLDLHEPQNDVGIELARPAHGGELVQP